MSPAPARLRRSLPVVPDDPWPALRAPWWTYLSVA